MIHQQDELHQGRPHAGDRAADRHSTGLPYGVTLKGHTGGPDGRGGREANRADGGARAGTGPFGTRTLARSRRADRRRCIAADGGAWPVAEARLRRG